MKKKNQQINFPEPLLVDKRNQHGKRKEKA